MTPPSAPDTPPLLPAPQEPPLLAAPPSPPPPPPAAPKAEPAAASRIKPISAAVLAGLLVLAFAVGWFVHHRRAKAAAESNEEARKAIPIVTVVPVKQSALLSELLLPGSLSPITEASLYARASGYVRKRYVDIGDDVKRGQVLAEIDSPELDEQVAQGRATLAQSRQQAAQAEASVGDVQARLDLARVTVQRYDTLLAQDSIARQDVDVQRQILQSAIAALASSKANVSAANEAVRAARFNLDRLIALQGYEKLRAPFDGVITARNIDEGTLISGSGASLANSGSSGGGATSSIPSSSGTTGMSSAGGGSSDMSGGGSSAGGGSSGGMEMFRIAQSDRLRVYVNVPQENAGAVQIGGVARVFIQQFPGSFDARVTRTSQSIDASSRTLLAEVQLPNAERTLMPGMYAQVRFSSARSNPPLLVPGETLIARAEGTSVATLVPLNDDERQQLADPDDRHCARKIHLQRVSLGRDYGTQIEITQGLRPQDVLVLNPGDTVHDDAVMLPELQQAQGGAAGGGGGGGGSAGKSGGGGGGGGSGGKSGGSGSGSGSGSGDGKGGGDAKSGGNASAAKGGGDAKGNGASQGGAGGGSKKEDPKARQAAEKKRRQTIQQSCIEDQVHVQAAAASASAASGADAAASQAPAGGAPTPGGDSDRSPAGIQSPSMRAPTQGGPGGQGKKG